jgi:ferrous iron transport protein B
MTCSARLPVYLLLIAAFIPNVYYLHGLLGLRTLVMLGLYLAGFVAAFTTARLLKSSILKSSDTPFILELPQYRMPTLYSLALRLLDRARIFMKNAGTIIVGVTLALWMLAHFPVIHTAKAAPTPAAACLEPHRPPGPLHRAGHRAARLQLEDRHRPALQHARARSHGQHHGHSLRRRSQHTGLSLHAALHHDMTLGGALALMIFFAFAMQCTSTIAVVKRETNSWTLARRAVPLHAGAGLRRRLRRQPDHHDSLVP